MSSPGLNVPPRSGAQGWDRPHDFATSVGARFLAYTVGSIVQHDIYQYQSPGGVVGIVGQTQESHPCTVRFEIGDDKLYSYQTWQDTSPCGVEKFPQGPNVANGRAR